MVHTFKFYEAEWGFELSHWVFRVQHDKYLEYEELARI